MCSFSFFVVDVVGEHGGGRQGAGSGRERREGGTRRGALAGGRGMSASGGKWEEKGIKKTEMEGGRGSAVEDLDAVIPQKHGYDVCPYSIQ